MALVAGLALGALVAVWLVALHHHSSSEAVAGWLAHAKFVVGVDTGLMHLAAALATPGVSLYGPTLPQMTGAFGLNQHWLCNADQPASIDRERPLTVSRERVIDCLRGQALI